MKKASVFPSWMVPAAVILLMGVVAFTGWTRQLELKILDLYTNLVPSPPERPEILLVDVDDQAIQRVGQWPWSRDIHARFAADLRALGASSLSFDVEFVDRGPVGVSSRERDAALAQKTAELTEVFGALKAKQLAVSEAGDAATTLLQEGILLTARDNDALLGQAMKVFGNAYSTLNYAADFINIQDNQDAHQALAYLMDHSAVGPVTGQVDRLRLLDGLRGNIVPIASNAAGAAVTNVQKDSDGTLRRMDLLYRVKGTDKVFAQLGFLPVWVNLGRPAIEVGNGVIVLKTSTLAQNPQPDVTIPLDASGQLIINWPHKDYKTSFHHLGVSELQTLDAAWDDPAKGLKAQVVAMQRAGYFDEDLEGAVNQLEAAREGALASGDQGAFDAAEQGLTAWRAQVGTLANGALGAQIRTALRDQAADPKVPQASRDKIPERILEVDQVFANLKAKHKVYSDLRAALAAKAKGALAIYGWTSEATTDLGVTPFDPVYFNPGTHASIANTILTGAYLNEWPTWQGFVLGVVLALLAAFAQTRLGTLTGVLAGFGIFAVLLLGIGVAYAATGVFAGALVPGLTVFFTVLGLTLTKFWGTERERRYIRQAFGTYLSPEVIKQLESDPDKLNLGGEKKVLTAVFTDVKGFSTISESMDPNDLVNLLNIYLTQMSDIILDKRGTIDKFEGDAIIAFWGAPLPFEDHAQLAVRAALEMKAAEAALNENLLQEKLAPSPLLTRIGINTGEMTVGNMGTARRMDYTMMGNAVNLAARLEGVNKQYGTWILSAQPTVDRLDGTVLTRKLDRVRVVGISTPVRLHEIHSFRSTASGASLEKIALFEKAIDVYEQRDWEGARRLLEAVLKIDPTDGPARVFLDRTAKNREAGLDAKWDGVYNLTTK